MPRPQLATEKCYRAAWGEGERPALPNLKNDSIYGQSGSALQDFMLSISSLKQVFLARHFGHLETQRGQLLQQHLGPAQVFTQSAYFFALVRNLIC